MIINKKDFKHKIGISASRLDLFLECSQKYAYSYLYKGPDKGNDGANRGGVVHDIFEILANKRHENIVNKVIRDKTCTKHSALWKLVNRHAKIKGVNSIENLELIDSFIVTGLKHDFYGPAGTIKVDQEIDFDFEVIKKGVSYRVRGFIDKVFFIEDSGEKYIIAMDFKSSKAKFDGEKITANNQAIIYSLALKYLYPEYKLKSEVMSPRVPDREAWVISSSSLLFLSKSFILLG
jgi:ATP-dependent helicase/DNAse subunit B